MRQWPISLALLAGVSGLNAQTPLVPEPELPPWCPPGTGCSTEVQTHIDGTLISGNTTLRMGQDGHFDRPVLLVEGFDFGTGWNPELHGHGSVTWNAIFGGDAVNFPMGLDYRPLLDELHAFGADVIFLDFEAGTASLEHKAALLSFVMTLIQDAKEGQDPSVMVGVSMGGLVGRIALTNWEHSGMPHCMGQFYSVDSPHLGATMPVGLQALILALSNHSEQGELLWNALNSSAGRQLLQHHIAGQESHQEAMAFLEQQGWPETCVNLAVVNSRPDANAQLTDEPLLHMEWGIGSPLNYQLAHVTAERWGGANSEGGAHLSLPGTIWPGDDTPLFQTLSIQFPQPDFDAESQPGATAGHLELLAQALSTSFPMDLLSEHVQTDVTFVPFTSAMASSMECPEGPWTETSMASLAMPRETHASLPFHHRNWMMNWIQGLWNGAWPGVIQQQYPVMTLGWNHPEHRVIQEVLIESGGQLVVGNTETPFAAITSACEGEIRVQHDGEIHVGTAQGARGELSISNGTDLVVGEDGRVVVHEGSTLMIKSHAQLFLDGGRLELRPGSQVVVAQGGRIAMTEGSTMSVANEATWTQGGILSVLAGQTAKIELEGLVNWKPGSKMWIGDLAQCEWTSENMACSRFDSGVKWSGQGHIAMEGGQLDFLPHGQLSLELSARFEDLEWTGHEGASAHLESSRSLTLRDCHLGMLRWQHTGHPDQTSLLLFGGNHWDGGWGKLSRARLRAWDNDFDFVTLHVAEARHPSRLVNNRWNLPWYEDHPALLLESCPSPVWLESNAWFGGRGIHLLEANAKFACNTWEDCTVAIALEGIGESCFSASCGGGGNMWSQNDVHFHLAGAALPLLSGGYNQLGPVEEQVAVGVTSSNVETMHIQQASWDGSLLDNPLLSVLSTDVAYCEFGECEEVVWWAEGLTMPRDCHAVEDPKPVKLKSTLSGMWNVLGQEVSTPPQ